MTLKLDRAELYTNYLEIKDVSRSLNYNYNE